jgi:hypothetical protein
VDITKFSDQQQEIVKKYIDSDGNFDCGDLLTPAQVRVWKEEKLDEIVTEMKGTYKTKKAALELIKNHADLEPVHRYYNEKSRYDQMAEKAKELMNNKRKQLSFQCLRELASQKLTDYTLPERICREYTCLSYLVNDYGNLRPEYAIVSKVDDKYATKKIYLYTISTGEERMYKCFGKTYESMPIFTNDIIRITEEKEDFKHIKDENGRWIPTKDTEFILKKYDKFAKNA